MNEECLLKYLLNPDELENLTQILENIFEELEPEKELVESFNIFFERYMKGLAIEKAAVENL